MTAASKFYIGTKTANMGTILPAVAGPALGAFAGRALGGRYPALGGELGTLIGGVSGGIGGQLMKEKVEQKQKAQMPMGAPYALDPTDSDIPAWALQGAEMFRPLMKRASHLSNLLGGDMGGAAWPVVEGVRNNLPPRQIVKDVAGQAGGTFLGGLAGHAVGHGIDSLAGHQVGVGGVPLNILLAGLGAAAGNFHGARLARV